MKNLSLFMLACLIVSCSSSTEPEPEPIPPVLIIHIDYENDDVEYVYWRAFEDAYGLLLRDSDTDCQNHVIDTVQDMRLVGANRLLVYHTSECGFLPLPRAKYKTKEYPLSIQEGDTVHVYATGMLEEQ